MSPVSVLGLSLVGGCVVLARTAFLQSSIARPLVGASLAGSVLGEPALGLWCGLLLELLWLTDAPMGAALPPDDALAGVLAAAFAWAAPETWAIDVRAALGVVLAMPCAFLGRWLDMGLRHWNRDLVARARSDLERGVARGLGRIHLLGSLRFFVAGALATMALSSAGVAGVRWLLPLLPLQTERGLELVALLLPALGTAAVMASWRGSRNAARFACGAAAWAVGALPGGWLRWLR